MKPMYKCSICHKILENKETIRLAKQLYGISYAGGHYTVEKYDFCKECYKKFNKWLIKHREEK